MGFDPGSRLGPYEIESVIGKGGMGEVYRARDMRLDRTVAIKVLAENRSLDPDMRQRFVREARAIGNLSHPNICHLNDLGSHEGIDFLVMEHLQGETLAERLKRARRPLPLDEVFKHAIEIADALSEAHRQGIVHRDLKPGNVMLTPSGVKLLDFGLARFSAPPPVGAATVSTIAYDHTPLTSEGVVLGTWQYMAPEQLEGRDADARADIFSFGTVVYEMATGRRAFDGDSQASVIAGILEREPPAPSSLEPNVPPALDRVVRKCLAKNPDARWQTTRDLVDELRWIDGERRAARPPVEAAPSVRARTMPWGWPAAVATAAAVAAAIVWNIPRPAVETSAPVRRFSIQAPPPAVPVGGFALSPDGRHIVIRARSNEGVQLYVRSLDQLEARVIPGTIGAGSHAFSPDGQSIVFTAGEELKATSLNVASAPVTIGPLTDCCAGGTINWFRDDAIMVPLIGKGIVRFSPSGGPAVSVSAPDLASHEIDHHSPFPMPDGKGMFIGIHRGADAFDVAWQRLDGRDRRVLVKDAFEPQYASTGHLVFARGETLLAAPFDIDRMAVTGAAVVMVEDVITSPDSGMAAYRFSRDGTLAYAPAPPRDGRRLMWLDRQGRVEPVAIDARAYSNPSLSPDGRRLAVQIEEGSRYDIWTHEFATGSLTRVTFDGASAAPIWTPDGQRITFTSTKDGRRQIYSQPADGSGQPELLVDDDQNVWAGSWSADLQTLVFTREPPTDQTDIRLLRLGQTSPTNLIASPAQEHLPRISPDGRWLAYTSNETGRFEIYLTPLSGASAKRQISVGGGSNAVWSRDGKELFYQRGNRFLVVSVASLPASVGRPVELPGSVQIPEARGEFFGHPGYDVGADGRLIMVERAAAEAAPGPINLVLNWFEELRRRVPVTSSR